MRRGFGPGVLKYERRLIRFLGNGWIRRLQAERRVETVYSFRYSRSRFVCDRLTGISVPFTSFIRRM